VPSYKKSNKPHKFKVLNGIYLQLLSLPFKGGVKCKKGKRLTIIANSFTKIDQQDDSAHWSRLEGKFQLFMEPIRLQELFSSWVGGNLPTNWEKNNWRYETAILKIEVWKTKECTPLSEQCHWDGVCLSVCHVVLATWAATSSWTSLRSTADTPWLLNTLRKKQSQADQKDLHEQFVIWKKCHESLKCLIYEMLLTRNKRLTWDTQTDYFPAKLFT